MNRIKFCACACALAMNLKKYHYKKYNIKMRQYLILFLKFFKYTLCKINIKGIENTSLMHIHIVYENLIHIAKYLYNTRFITHIYK